MFAYGGVMSVCVLKADGAISGYQVVVCVCLRGMCVMRCGFWGGV